MVAAARCCRRASATMRWLDVGWGAAAAEEEEEEDDGPPSCGRGWDDLLEGVLLVETRVVPALAPLVAAAAVEVEVPGAGPRREAEADADARVRPVMRGRATDGWTCGRG